METVKCAECERGCAGYRNIRSLLWPRNLSVGGTHSTIHKLHSGTKAFLKISISSSHSAVSSKLNSCYLCKEELNREEELFFLYVLLFGLYYLMKKGPVSLTPNESSLDQTLTSSVTPWKSRWLMVVLQNILGSPSKAWHADILAQKPPCKTRC